MTKSHKDDQTELGDALAPAFITEGEPATDLPTFVDTANVRSLYGWKPGESLGEAIARHRGEQCSASSSEYGYFHGINLCVSRNLL